jgi:DNA-directed RNA polymerase subunit RPC12/RpoP
VKLTRSRGDTHTAPPQPLGRCANCGSGFVQPHAWRERTDGRLTLELRCPECLMRTVGSFRASEVAAYDQRLIKGRLQVEAAYEAVRRSNMTEELKRLRRALELDLIGADDFAPARAR